MKTIKPDELFQSLSEFLKAKGIELKAGAYAERIHRACNLLGDTINATQSGARNAKSEVDKRLEKVRQYIHEATAPKPPPAKASKPASSGTRRPRKAGPSRKKPAASARRTRKP